MADELSGVRHLIDRQGLPARINELVKHIETQGRKLEDPLDRGWQEVRQLQGLVDGNNILAAIVAHYAANVSLPEQAGTTPPTPPEPKQDPVHGSNPTDNPLYPDDLLPGDNPPKEPREKLAEQERRERDGQLPRDNPNAAAGDPHAEDPPQDVSNKDTRSQR